MKFCKVVGITSYVHLLMVYLPEERNKIRSNLDFKYVFSVTELVSNRSIESICHLILPVYS